MINFIDIEDSKPFHELKKLYENACKHNQDYVEAMCIGSYSLRNKEISSRFVNLKFIKNNEFYFFSNYNSPKSLDFKNHSQITSTFFWSRINSQIRIKGKIFTADKDISDKHFLSRSIEKNALAISSKQSEKISSYNEVINNYESTLNFLKNSKELNRPDYWGGFYFIPYYFEFWIGNKYRINQRKEFFHGDNGWEENILQP
jgi:pyridoxamine 5'-phosphate oxidase|tara:strand:+ start:287 stop:892 length:606 start_codon:yes stop_codon:yes gene_type:complete